MNEEEIGKLLKQCRKEKRPPTEQEFIDIMMTLKTSGGKNELDDFKNHDNPDANIKAVIYDDGVAVTNSQKLHDDFQRRKASTPAPPRQQVVSAGNGMVMVAQARPGMEQDLHDYLNPKPISADEEEARQEAWDKRIAEEKQKLEETIEKYRPNNGPPLKIDRIECKYCGHKDANLMVYDDEGAATFDKDGECTFSYGDIIQQGDHLSKHIHRVDTYLGECPECEDEASIKVYFTNGFVTEDEELAIKLIA